MATRLKLVFSGAGEKKVTILFPYAHSSAMGAEVKALMQGIVVDSSIYEDVPKGIIEAKFLDSTSTPISLG